MATITQFLYALAHYAQLHPVRTVAAVSLGVLVVLLVAARVRYGADLARRLRRRRGARPNARIEDVRWWRRFLRPALVLAATLTLAAAGLALAYRGYADRIVDEEVVEYVEREPSTTFGIDVSHYQARVNWAAVADSEHPIRFVFVRASMGVDGEDERFRENWRGAGRQGLLRGAYHYFRPREDAEEQFLNFASRVTLGPDDLRPVLDIEERSRKGDAYLRTELQRWLDLAEAHYGVKPILYTGEHFYRRRLAGHFDGYPLWIAKYSGPPDTSAIDWRIHQFSDKVRVRGILDRVDGNVYRGTLTEMDELRVGGPGM